MNFIDYFWQDTFGMLVLFDTTKNNSCILKQLSDMKFGSLRFLCSLRKVIAVWYFLEENFT